MGHVYGYPVSTSLRLLSVLWAHEFATGTVVSRQISFGPPCAREQEQPKPMELSTGEHSDLSEMVEADEKRFMLPGKFQGHSTAT